MDDLRRGGCDETILAGVGEILNHTDVVVISQDRHQGAGRTTVQGFRRARRAIDHAVRFDRPIVMFIDTPGADPSATSESDGIAREISATFDALLSAPVPTVAVVVGEGGSGGALALAACDTLLILENAIFSVIAPEGAASILKLDDVASVSRDLRLTAHDLRELGIADRVLPEPPGGAQQDPDQARRTVHHAVASALESLTRKSDSFPTARRLDRWRVFR